MASPRTRTRTRKPKPSVERDLAVRMFEVMALMRAVEDRMVTMYRQAVHHMTILGFSYDHRAFDGVTGSRFLAFIRDVLQDRDWEAELG